MTVLGLAPVLVNEGVVRLRSGWVVVWLVLTVRVEGKEVLMLVIGVGWGWGTLSLTSVCAKAAFLASMGVVVGEAVLVNVRVEVEVTVGVAVKVAEVVAGRFAMEMAVEVAVEVSISSSVSERFSSWLRVYGERERSSCCSPSSSSRMSSSQSKLSSELSSEESGASCLITGEMMAVGRVSIGVVCGGKVKRPFVPK